MKTERAAAEFHRNCFCRRTARILSVVVVATCFLARSSKSVDAVCTKDFTREGIAISYKNCSDLLMQDASIAWSYENRNRLLRMAFSGDYIADGWVGWGINPDCPRMVGSSVLITFKTVNGSKILPYKLNGDLLQRSYLVPGQVDIEFVDTSSSISGTDFTIFTTVRLKPNQTKINMVWNRGPFLIDYTPSPHFFDEQSLSSVAVLDVLDRGVTNIGDCGCSVVVPHRHQKKKHGLIAGVAWGILYPVGVIIGWFTVCFPDTFLYIYVPFHLTSFAVGMAGFYSGNMLKDLSGSVSDNEHQLLAVLIVTLGTIQLLLFILRTASTTGVGGEFVRHLQNWFCTYNFMLAFCNFFLIAAEIFSGMRLLNPNFTWGFKWLVISGVVFLVYICNCAGMKNYRRHLQARLAAPPLVFTFAV
ncbi:hypothetical protein R1flu_027016 [Riccia fluitans]|uniref:Cytochrome b561 and DOMON domain-containing protein n=1 Tax=Riccia fluitans TaxID=41844 RepID=A0ABD1XLN9_9MARC